jgi:hypothetical protein
LQPAHDDLLERTHQVAAILNGYDLENTYTLTSAPARVRTAYRQLPELLAQHQLIFSARRQVSLIANRQPTHDTTGIFSEFRSPFSFAPDWVPGSAARVPEVPAPSDATARLLWKVSGAAAPAQPWLPTPDQQAKPGPRHSQT